MILRHWLRPTLAGLAVLCATAGTAVAQKPPVIEFNRHIRPILSDNCFACHGFDKNQRKADLRLDNEAGAFAQRDGDPVLVRGKPAASALFDRITRKKAGRMPPPKTGKSLTPQQVALIRLWIEQGAKYEKHWSLIPAKRPAVPTPKGSTPRNAIDAFVRARLDLKGLKPSPEADRRTLARRLSFDLLGLPPAPEVVDAFVNDRSSLAYEKLVDRLLASKHYGERLAIYWLDVVRFADTNGIHGDNHREIAPYRDYVIDAFNDNKPFDRFVTEQLAGDLLPGSTREQKIASGFNRLLMTTREGGAQAKEYLAKYSADRVRNTASIFLGVTLGCAECHDHKFDPLTQKDFYSFAAFFADIREVAVGAQPTTRFPTPAQEQALRALDREMATLRAELARLKPARGLLPLALRVSTEAAHARLQQRKQQLLKTVPETEVSMSGPPRTIRILRRGNWLDDSGPVVTPDTPAALPPLGVKGRRATRLDLARWMTAPDNPLVARVFVNRLWKLFFGQGLVKTLDDLGSQGAWPTHPDLLDWLATEFRESGWDVKHLVKLIVLSETYRQTSAVSEQLRQADPYNQLLARQGRFRLDAEMVRDNALAVSGLLVHRLGGRSVKPYQPAGYWAHLNFPTREWQKDSGEALYRRGVYTYWCRTFLHPSLLAFDAPSREECTAERPRSNTPQQALVLLNDPSYVEAARVLAERIVRRGGKEPEGRIRFAYRRVLQRPARPAEVKLLSALYAQHLEQYRKDSKAAAALLRTGDWPMPQGLDVPELAAWTSVARVLLNLHETITRN